VQQRLDARVQAHESAELRHAADHTLHHLADVVQLVHLRPRVRLQALERQPNAAAFLVQTQHVHIDLVAHVQQFARVLDAVPGQLADVNQAVGSTEIDERAEIAQAAHHAAPGFAFAQVFEQRILARVADLALGLALAEHQAPPPAVDLDHLDRDRLADHVDQVGLALVFTEPARQINHMAGRDEAAQIAERHDQAAAVGVGDDALPHIFGRHHLFSAQPVFILLGLRHRDDHVAVLVLGADDHHRDFSPNGERCLVAELLHIVAGHDAVTLHAEVH